MEYAWNEILFAVWAAATNLCKSVVNPDKPEVVLNQAGLQYLTYFTAIKCFFLQKQLISIFPDQSRLNLL